MVGSTEAETIAQIDHHLFTKSFTSKLLGTGLRAYGLTDRLPHNAAPGSSCNYNFDSSLPVKHSQINWDTPIIKSTQGQINQISRQRSLISDHSQADLLAPVGVNASKTTVSNDRKLQQHVWVSENIKDDRLRSAIVRCADDGLLDRTDMLSIFEKAEDGNKVDRIELSDLRQLISGVTGILMPDSVQNLASKVVNGDRANQSYQGSVLGNLHAGSSAHHLDKTIDKWFFGGDHPLAQSYYHSKTIYDYKLADKPLFKNGASYGDVKQGDTGDCYFLASLASIALHAPSELQNMFIDNRDGSYTVRFYKPNGNADYVTVDRYLPVDSWGDSAYADYSKELWVALVEKAYAQLNESDWIRPNGNNKNSYQGISAGLANESTEQITGQSMRVRPPLDLLNE